MFLEEAAGKTNKELMIRMPTHFIDIVTTTAIIEVKMISRNFVFTPLLTPKILSKLTIKRLLKMNIHIIITHIKTMARRIISFGVMPRISPMRKFEYLLKLLFIESSTIPMATPVDEKTPIIVSIDELFVFFTIIMAA